MYDARSPPLVAVPLTTPDWVALTCAPPSGAPSEARETVPEMAPVSPTVKDPERNARNIKGAAYYMATDAVGLSRCPEWAY